MRFNPSAGGSKSGFLKKCRTYQRDREIQIQVKELGHAVIDVAKFHGLHRQRVYQILGDAERDSFPEDPEHYWKFVAHHEAVKEQAPYCWKRFVAHWQKRLGEAPPKPNWLR